MRERDLLRHIYERSADLAAIDGIQIGPGDDCAVIGTPGDSLLLTVDQLIAHRHFSPQTTPLELIARKAIARSVSDIAAMGGSPVCGLATGCLPDGFKQADELFDHMATWARRFGAPLVGGDIATTQGPMVLTCTIIGRPHPSRGPVLRSQAHPGDKLWATGCFGGSLESNHHLQFEPRIEAAAALCDTLANSLGAMLDVSDGLGLDASRIAEASGVRIEIDAARIPQRDGIDDWHRAVADGEDYELLFTTRAGCEPTGLTLPRSTPLTAIGRIVEGEGCVIIDPSGQPVDASQLGWDHTT